MKRILITEEEKKEILQRYNLLEDSNLHVQVSNGNIILNNVTYRLIAKTMLKNFTIRVISLIPAQVGYNITFIHPISKNEQTLPIKPETIDLITRNIGQPEINLPGGKSLIKV